MVIEAKKSTSKDDTQDKEKLKLHKKELGYKYAYFIKFPIGKKLKEIKPNDYIEEIHNNNVNNIVGI